MSTAYSYLRFSRPEQMRGDSQRRQVTKSQDWADRKKVPLDDSLDLRDLGVSAFRGKNAQLIAEWAPKVQGAVRELIKDENTTIRVDDVWKFLGSPDKAQFRSPILKNLQALRDAEILTQHKRGNSNFGIYYTSGPAYSDWK